MRITFLLFVLLGMATLGLVHFVGQYEQTGPELLANDWVIPKRDRAFVQYEGGLFSLSSRDGKQTVNIYQKGLIPGVAHFVNLEADLMCRELVAGENSSSSGLFFLVQYDALGKSLTTERVVTMMEGSRDWQRYQKVFQVSSGAVSFKVYGQLNRCTGSMQMKNVSLSPVAKGSVYPWIKAVILGAWGLFFISVLGSYKIEGDFWGKLFFLMCYGGILFATTIPDELRDRLMESFGLRGDTIDMVFIQATGLRVDEIGHLLAFALFGASLVFFVPQSSFVVCIVNVFLLAGGTELVQVLIDSRTAKLFDFYIDFSGGMAGILLAQLVCVLRNRTMK